MIDGLIAGKLYGQPSERTSKAGKPFAIAKVRAAGSDGESLFVNVIAFDAAPCAALLALADGDSVALSGTLTPKVWTDKEGTTRPALDLVAHQVLSAYHVTKKRKAMQREQAVSGDTPVTPVPAPQRQRPRDEAWQARAPQEHSGLDEGAPLDW